MPSYEEEQRRERYGRLLALEDSIEDAARQAKVLGETHIRDALHRLVAEVDSLLEEME